MTNDETPSPDTPTETPKDNPEHHSIKPVEIDNEIKKRFLDYAMSVIVSRALPDAKDGLKPVHRRIIYSMHINGLGHTASYKKSANVVGSVLGSFHPHGDSSVYDAMVRMAQPWSLRYPLIDGQGNFGSQDGDNAAAYRYTEAKLQKISKELTTDLDKNTIPWQPNYDGSKQEPQILPTKLPNLLLNGATGIAVGMACSFAPHNLTETCNALQHLLNNPDATTDDLLQHIPGPDFPTGANAYGGKDIRKGYQTGKGKTVIRCTHHFEEMKRGKTRIVFTDVPYQTNKANIVTTIADKYKEGILDGLAAVRDESNREGIRIVLEIKADVDPQIFLNKLWKYTPLQTTYSMNHIAIVNGQPKTLTLKDMLTIHLDHRRDVITKRTQYDMEAAQKRDHIVEGLLIALMDIDKAVKTIRNSTNPDDAKDALIKTFKLTDNQAKAILDMRLQKLTGLEVETLENEHKELLAFIKDCQDILARPERRNQIIHDELDELKKHYGDKRRTKLHEANPYITHEDFIQEEQCIYTWSKQGYLKRMPLDVYREQRRGGRGVKGAKTKEDDYVVGTMTGSTHDYLCVFTSQGRLFWIKGYDLGEASRTSMGRPIINYAKLEDGEEVETIIPVRDFQQDDQHLVFITQKGITKRVKLSDFKNIRSNGVRALNFKDNDDRLLTVLRTNGVKDIIIATSNGQACRFNEDKIRVMGRTAAGVRGITLTDDDHVIGAAAVEEGEEMIVITEKGYGKRTRVDDYRLTNRGGKGVKNLKVTNKTGRVVSLKQVTDLDSVVAITNNGMVVRFPAAQLRTMGRATQGVKAVNIKNDDTVSQITIIRADSNDDEEETTENDTDSEE